jgi:uncharacterized protein
MSTTSPFPPYQTPYPLYSGMTWTSQYVTMRDGVRLAVDVYLPKGLPPGVRLPVLLTQSRYWRAIEAITPLSWFIPNLEDLMPVIGKMKAFFARHGYAQVYVDVRGTGASFGVWRYPWERASLDDARDLLDWIVAQPWCDGQVGGMGISYLGTTAELLLAARHPAVKAIVPMYNHPDPFIDITFPGGLFNERFIREWSEMDHYQDRNQLPPVMGKLAQWAARGVRPVNGDRAAIAAAVEEHAANGSAYQIIYDATFRDEIEPEVGVSVENLAIHNYRQAIEESRTPSYGWASWLDAGTADAALRRFLTYPGADHVTIGAWNHGGFMQASPYRPPDAPLSPSIDEQWGEMVRFFDAHLKQLDTRASGERLVNYFTLGAEQWQHSPTWPPPGVRTQRWYLAGERSLRREPPGDEDGTDTYQVDFLASTGDQNRWWELSAAFRQTIEFRQRAAQGERLLAYLSPPFESEVELCGNPVLRLELTADVADCAFYAYLEDLAPDGQVYYLTEGQLRAVHRRISPAAPYSQLGPYHSFRQADAWPLTPGEIAEITFSLQPVSALIRGGHRLRLGLAGHDDGTFPRFPAHGDVQWRVLRNSLHPSWLDLPMLIK